MNFFLLNIVLAGAWAALIGAFTVENIIGGFFVGYGMLIVSHNALGCTNYISKVQQVFLFLTFFLYELIQANLRVAWEVMTPGMGMSPAIVGIPLDVDSDLEILLLATIITLTPGTLSLDVSTDKRTLYVHGMYVHNVERFRERIKKGFERRVVELFR